MAVLLLCSGCLGAAGHAVTEEDGEHVASPGFVEHNPIVTPTRDCHTLPLSPLPPLLLPLSHVAHSRPWMLVGDSIMHAEGAAIMHIHTQIYGSNNKTKQCAAIC